MGTTSICNEDKLLYLLDGPTAILGTVMYKKLNKSMLIAVLKNKAHKLVSLPQHVHETSYQSLPTQLTYFIFG